MDASTGIAAVLGSRSALRLESETVHTRRSHSDFKPRPLNSSAHPLPHSPGLDREQAPETAFDVAWRSQTRKALIARRVSADPLARAQWSAAIDRQLLQLWPDPKGHVIAFCWPHMAEHDVRSVIEHWISLGATAALPVVVAPRSPLIFRHWHPGVATKPGPLGIPTPIDSEELRPDTLLIPANGFDACGFRLGYGAGYFDRTISALRPAVRVIGVAYEIGRLPSIHPQPHDEAMDMVVTEAGVHTSVPGSPRDTVD